MRLDRKKIQLLMASLGINQKTLALKAEISRQTISAVMNGRSCRPEVLGRIAKALNTKPEDILSAREAAKILGCDPQAVRERIRLGIWTFGECIPKSKTGCGYCGC